MFARIQILIFALALLPLAARAQGITASLNSSGNVRVDQPEALTKLLQRVEGGADAAINAAEKKSPRDVKAGFRIMVYDDNNPRTARANAQANRKRVEERFPNLRTYIMFNSPYWRVKAGDYRTRAEAEAAMAELRAAMPALGPYLRIVRDRINTND